MRITRSIFLVILCFAFTQCGSKRKNESEYQPSPPVIPVVETDLGKEDLRGRVRSVEAHHGYYSVNGTDSVFHASQSFAGEEYSHFAEFDTAGNLVREVQYGYDSLPDIEFVHTFEKGLKTKTDIWDGKHVHTKYVLYEYDSLGRKTSLVFYDLPSRKPTSRFVYTYDSLSRERSKDIYRYIKDKDSTFLESKVRYDYDDGSGSEYYRLKAYEYNYGGTLAGYHERSMYVHTGKLSQVTLYTDTTIYQGHIAYNYNKKGWLGSKTVTGDDNCTYQYMTDQQGNWIERVETCGKSRYYVKRKIAYYP